MGGPKKALTRAEILSKIRLQAVPEAHGVNCRRALDISFLDRRGHSTRCRQQMTCLAWWRGNRYYCALAVPNEVLAVRLVILGSSSPAWARGRNETFIVAGLRTPECAALE